MDIKKRLICILAPFLIGGFFTSCEEDGTSSSKEAVTVQENLSQRGGRTDGIIFEFLTEQRAIEIAEGPLPEYILELSSQMGMYPEAVAFRSTVAFTNYKVKLKSYGFIDSHNNIIEEFVFNDALGTFQSFSGAPVEPNCPSGFSDLGVCNNLTNLRNCLGVKMATYAYQNMSFAVSDVGHGVIFSFVNTSSGVRVCGSIH